MSGIVMQRLPPKFSREMPRKYTCPAYLINGSCMWKVQLETGTAKNASYITAGWPKFAKDFSLRENTLVTFKHMGNLNFKVTCMKIYKGQNNFTCFQERRYEKLHRQHTKGKENCDDDRLHLAGKAGLQILDEDPLDMELYDVVPTPFEREIKGHRKKQLVSFIVSSFHFTFPTSKIKQLMMSSVMYPKIYRQTIPSEFARDAKLHNKVQVVLLQPDRRTSARPVRLLHIGRGTIRMGRGWPVFCRQQNLQEGDFCTFSLNTNYTHPKMVYVNVSIRRKMDK